MLPNVLFTDWIFDLEHKMRELVCEETPFPFGLAFCCPEEADFEALAEGERSIVSPTAISSRKSHFAMGRIAAHRALGDLEKACLEKRQPESCCIGAGTAGEPLWPSGIVGSISHVGNLAASIVLKEEDARGVGIDIEQIERKVSFDISRRVCLDEEMPWILETGISELADIRLKTIFSCKEAVFKAFYPTVHAFFWFHDVLLQNIGPQWFQATLLKPLNHYPKGLAFKVCALDFHGYLVSCAILTQAFLKSKSFF